MIASNIAFQSDRAVHSGDHLEMDLGMDSLAITELQVFVEKSFGVLLAPGWPNQFPTVIDLARHVAETKTRMEAQGFDWSAILREPVAAPIVGSGWIMRVVQSLWRILFATRLRLETTGRQHLPAGACIIAPNHQSYMDPLFLLAGLPRRQAGEFSFLAKEKHFSTGLKRRIARDANVIVLDINRNIVASVQQIAAALRAGRKVVIFPEGTRTRSGRLGDFKKTFAIIAAELGIPVVPVAIRGAWDLLPAHHFIPRRGTVRVDFLPPVIPAGADSQALCVETRARVAAGLAGA
jgi:long-chain acyl-CoA synthetase